MIVKQTAKSDVAILIPKLMMNSVKYSHAENDVVAVQVADFLAVSWHLRHTGAVDAEERCERAIQTTDRIMEERRDTYRTVVVGGDFNTQFPREMGGRVGCHTLARPWKNEWMEPDPDQEAEGNGDGSSTEEEELPGAEEGRKGEKRKREQRQRQRKRRKGGEGKRQEEGAGDGGGRSGGGPRGSGREQGAVCERGSGEV